jgi:Holin of 3TMs, for gene-transfer release
MSDILESLVGGVAKSNPLSIVLDIGRSVINRVWPDPVKQAEAQLEFAKLVQQGEFKALEADVSLALAQIANNTEDSKSGSAFRGGWRPFIGWTCGIGLAYQLVIMPLGNSFISFMFTMSWIPMVFRMDSLDTSTLMTLLTGMLGLGGMRTYERITGKIK